MSLIESQVHVDATKGLREAKKMLTAVGANLRERRTRLKRKFETCRNHKSVPCPSGCSLQSWQLIYESTKDVNKQKKSPLCRAAADLRLSKRGYTHHCRPKGLKGLHDRFVSYFSIYGWCLIFLQHFCEYDS